MKIRASRLARSALPPAGRPWPVSPASRARIFTVGATVYRGVMLVTRTLSCWSHCWEWGVGR